MQASVKQALTLADKPGTIQLSLEYDGNQLGADTVPKATSSKSAPTLKLHGAGSGHYIAVCLDIDAPFQTAAFLSPILHWIQPGLKSSSTTTAVLEHEDRCLADWLAPSPPPFSGPHRYLFILYEQPADFDVSKWASELGTPVGVLKRMRWSLDDFAKKAGLHDVIAANFFRSN